MNLTLTVRAERKISVHPNVLRLQPYIISSCWLYLDRMQNDFVPRAMHVAPLRAADVFSSNKLGIGGQILIHKLTREGAPCN